MDPGEEIADADPVKPDAIAGVKPPIVEHPFRDDDEEFGELDTCDSEVLLDLKPTVDKKSIEVDNEE
jgi:hypothetical protein